MKKTLLSIGTLVSTIAPVASVIACGDGDVPGHEAPYKITIQADATKPTQANVEIKLKGYVSESYLKEIKSRIVESIVAANKDALKYSTIQILLGTITNPLVENGLIKLIDTTPLTDANKNDLDAIHNFIDSTFDDLINKAKTSKSLLQYFKKDVWENIHHEIDKVNQDEIKTRLLKLCGYENSNLDLIDFEYKVISDKHINFTITRTDVVSTPEIAPKFFAIDAYYPPFLPGEKINMNMNFNSKHKYSDKDLSSYEDVLVASFNSKIAGKNGFASIDGASGGLNASSQFYKIAKYLLKANGYSDDISLVFPPYNFIVEIDDLLKPLGNSASKVFGYGDNGQFPGINSLNDRYSPLRKFKIDFEKKTFKIMLTVSPHDEKQWIFGTNGHLVIEPTKEWTLEFEGTYELNDAGDAVETITSLTKRTATDGTNTVRILESSAEKIVKSLTEEGNVHLFHGGW